MTIFLTREELSKVLSETPLVNEAAKKLGWDQFRISVFAVHNEEDGFEIWVNEAPEQGDHP